MSVLSGVTHARTRRPTRGATGPRNAQKDSRVSPSPTPVFAGDVRGVVRRTSGHATGRVGPGTGAVASAPRSAPRTRTASLALSQTEELGNPRPPRRRHPIAVHAAAWGSASHAHATQPTAAHRSPASRASRRTHASPAGHTEREETRTATGTYSIHQHTRSRPHRLTLCVRERSAPWYVRNMEVRVRARGRSWTMALMGTCLHAPCAWVLGPPRHGGTFARSLSPFVSLTSTRLAPAFARWARWVRAPLCGCTAISPRSLRGMPLDT